MTIWFATLQLVEVRPREEASRHFRKEAMIVQITQIEFRKIYPSCTGFNFSVYVPTSLCQLLLQTELGN